jgi:NAD-dependent deacetylase
MTRVASKTTYAAELLARARHAIALTGAGISTPSGIPDFRSEGTGLWSRVDPEENASLLAFRYDPARFYRNFKPLAAQIHQALPNPAHFALAALEKAEKLHCILTQNVDVLHRRAGSRCVVEIHGTLDTMTCVECFHQVDAAPFLHPYLEEDILPRCPHCGGILKPDVILFGEQLPQKAWMQAEEESRRCDFMLVAGSSLEVLPAARLPMNALDRGAHLVIINQTPTYLDIRADVVIHGDAAEILPEITEQVLHGSFN